MKLLHGRQTGSRMEAALPLSWYRAGALALALLLIACEKDQPPPAPLGTPTHVIDPSVYSGPASLPDAGVGPRPLTAMADGRGVVSRFISNEVIFRGSQADLAPFLAKHNGIVIATIAPATAQPSFVIRLDPSSFSLQNLDADSAAMGLRGQMKFASDQGARLTALVASDVVSGSQVSLNFVSEGHGFIYSTTEQPDANNVSDAFKWNEFDRRAWQFVAAHNFSRRVTVAIIDGGFWLNGFGIPCDLLLDATCAPSTIANGRSDLPAQPMQFNTVGGGSPFAGGPNPNTCTGGSACPWHGTGSASVAVGALNNQAGAAGTGGQVADPILLKTDLSDGSVAAAILDAMGADIINMSFGSHCNDWCRMGHDLSGLNGFMDGALDAGILVVASAGNDATDAGEQQIYPCQYTSANTGNGVYCVGALNPANNGTAAPYSNFGTTVNIWAPTNIHAMANGASNGALTTFSGTSASAPFVAGVAAMMKAIDPRLDGNHLKSIIGNGPFQAGTATFGFPYTDPKVSLVIWPYQAVVAAAGGYHIAPDLRITEPQDGALIQSGGVSVPFKAFAADVNDGSWPIARMPNSIVTWTSDVDGPFPQSGLDATAGTSVAFDFTLAPEGLRHISASVTNSAGLTATSTIAITVKFAHVNPTPVITWPLPNATVPAGTYWLTGFARSTDPGALGNFSCDRLFWDGIVPSQLVPGSNGLCRAQATLSPGVQQISLTATDKFGDSGTTTASVTVQQASGLAVQILTPLPDSGNIVTIGGNTSIGLSGSANTLPSSLAGYSWYWYLTASGATSKQPILSGLFLSAIDWKPERSGLCKTTNTQDVTVGLEVADVVPSDPSKNTSGSSEVNIQITCERVN